MRKVMRMSKRSMVEVEEEGVKSIVVGGRRFLPEVRRLKDMVEVVCDKQFLELSLIHISEPTRPY